MQPTAQDYVWRKFMAGDHIDPSLVRPIILQSWHRCRDRQQPPYGSHASSRIPDAELHTLLSKNKSLITAALPFMHNLYKLMEDSGFVVVLASAEGLILEVIGNKESNDSNQSIHYVRGSSWTEACAGTTAIGLVLLGSGPIQVAGAEHFYRENQKWACSAAPILDANGTFLGVLSVTGPKKQVHCHTLGMVVSAAAAISNLLTVQVKQRELEESAHIHSTIVNSISDGLLMLNGKGIVTHINPTGAKILRLNPQEAVGKPISSLLDFKPVVLRCLETGVGYTDKEFFIETNRGTLHFVKTAIVIKDESGNVDAVVDIFREIKRVHKLVNHMVGATARFAFEDIIGFSPALSETVKLAKIASHSAANVLIQGESGTGKELIAQAIHNGSPRADGPFVAINCGAIPRDLVESELFGYEDGAFTGARHGGRPGKFELANGGTILLDEIGEMPLDIQVKLLRVLQDKRISRVGGQRYIGVDVRIIAATNRDLEQEVREGNFRADLYYRLNVLPVLVPPLRERNGDIEMLVTFLLTKMCQELGVAIKRFSPEALQFLAAYDWPGNVRELENVVERAVNICAEQEISTEYLPRNLLAKPSICWPEVSLKEMEFRHITETLEKSGGNISIASKLLGIGRNTLYAKLKEYQIAARKPSGVR